jgi:hypothetical protein
MGWSNFILIPSLNIAVEVSRDLHDLEDYEEKAFDYLTSEEFDEGIDIDTAFCKKCGHIMQYFSVGNAKLMLCGFCGNRVVEMIKL